MVAQVLLLIINLPVTTHLALSSTLKEDVIKILRAPVIIIIIIRWQ